MPMFTKQRDTRQTQKERYNRYSYDPTYEQHQNQQQQQQQQQRAPSTHNDSYEDLFKQFERLKVKAETLAEKDPIFALRLENLARQFAEGRRSRAQQRPSTNAYRFTYQATPQPTPAPPPPNFVPFHQPPNFYNRHHMPTPPPSAKPQREESFYANSNSFGFKPSRKPHRNQQHNNNHKKYHFGNDSEFFYVMEDTHDPRKITVQMSRLQLGPNGEKQRVIVERDFNNEDELSAFLAEFEENISKVTSNTDKKPTNKENSSDSFKSPGVIVVEEPGEEPRLYRQDTGELVTDADGIFVGSAGIDPNRKNDSQSYYNYQQQQQQQNHHHHHHHHHGSKRQTPTNNENPNSRQKKNSQKDETHANKTKQSDKNDNDNIKSTENSKSNEAETKKDSSNIRSKSTINNERNEPENSSDDDTLQNDRSTKSRNRNETKKPNPIDTKKHRQSEIKKKKGKSKHHSSDSSSSKTRTPYIPPTNFTSKVGYHRQTPAFVDFIRHNPPPFYHPHIVTPPPQPHPPPPPITPQFIFQPSPSMARYYRLPSYGRISFLNSRYGFQSNMKQRSGSFLFENDNSATVEINEENNDKKHEKTRIYEATIAQSPKRPSPISASLHKRKIYASSKNINNTQRMDNIYAKLERIVSYSSVSKATQRNPLKKDLAKLCRKNPKFYYDNLIGLKNTCAVVKERRTKQYKIYTNFKNDDTNDIYGEFTKQYHHEQQQSPPTYFQPGFYPPNLSNSVQYQQSYSNLNNANIPLNLFL